MRSCREKYRTYIFAGRVRHACHLPPPRLLGTWTAEGGPLDETVVESRCDSAIEGNIHETLMIEILET